jgi:N-acetyltransferase 10
VPLYVRQTTSELTGEHTCVMVRGLNTSVESELEWLREFVRGKICVHLRYFLFGLTCI